VEAEAAPAATMVATAAEAAIFFMLIKAPILKINASLTYATTARRTPTWKIPPGTVFCGFIREHATIAGFCDEIGQNPDDTVTAL
jgi:hypothetical protein